MAPGCVGPSQCQRRTAVGDTKAGLASIHHPDEASPTCPAIPTPTQWQVTSWLAPSQVTCSELGLSTAPWAIHPSWA